MDEKEKRRLAKSIVDAIIDDLSDRRGLSHEWDAIDRDIRYEIRETWVAAVAERLP